MKLDIKIQQEKIAYEDQYVYLGQLVSFTNKQEIELNRRLALAWKLWSLKDILKGKFSKTVKQNIIDSCVTSILSYGCQTWSNTKKHLLKISIAQ